MPHQRQLIREAVKDALVAANTAAGSRVYKTRKVPHRLPELPAISVYTLEESVDPESATTAPRYLTRRMQLMIEAVMECDPDENIDDALDDMALEIERAMHADDSLDGTCMDSIPAGTEIEVAIQGQREIGLLQLTYTVTYETNAPDEAPADLVDFETAHVSLNLDNDQDTADQVTGLIENLEE